MTNTHTLNKLEQRDRELETARAALARLSDAISHEINSPINTLNQLLDLFDDEQRARLDKEGQESLNMILAGARRCQAVARGLEGYSTSTRAVRNEALGCVSCEDVVSDVLQALAPQIALSLATIEVSELPTINTAQRSLTAILTQFVANALKFSEKNNATPTISIRATKNEDGVEITVADNGIGVKAGKEDLIFDLFTKLNNKSDYEGAGLGLPMCLQMAAGLGGRVWVTHGETNGAVFHLFLPQTQGADLG